MNQGKGVDGRRGLKQEKRNCSQFFLKVQQSRWLSRFCLGAFDLQVEETRDFAGSVQQKGTACKRSGSAGA